MWFDSATHVQVSLKINDQQCWEWCTICNEQWDFKENTINKSHVKHLHVTKQKKINLVTSFPTKNNLQLSEKSS